MVDFNLKKFVTIFDTFLFAGQRSLEIREQGLKLVQR